MKSNEQAMEVNPYIAPKSESSFGLSRWAKVRMYLILAGFIWVGILVYMQFASREVPMRVSTGSSPEELKRIWEEYVKNSNTIP